MILYVAQTNASVGFGNTAHNIDGRSAQSNSQMNAIGRVAVNARDAPKRLFARKLDFFRIAVLAVASQRKHKRYVFIAYARARQFVK